MEARDVILLLLTFIVGVCAGAYIYFVGFVPAYVATDETGVVTSESFEIIGEAYGGCARIGCDSFRLTEKRSFQYLDASTTTGPVTGTYPRRSFRDLERVVTTDRLVAAAVPIRPDFCQSFVDGVDYRFTITLDEVRYELDTCTTTLGSDPDLLESLQAIFSIIKDPAVAAYSWESFQTAGVIGYLWPELFD